jgi:hypothetical protein
MKKIFLFFILLFAAMVTKAQEDKYNNKGNTGFRKDNVFLGGSISLGFGSGSFGVGANPEVGYSFSQWLDAGVIFNLNYNSQKYDYNYDYLYDGKVSSFNYGGGVFLRAYPIHFLFLQIQPEENWITYKDKSYIDNISGKTTVSATSLIGGIGYTQRVVGQSSFYTMIGIDLLNNVNSPYRDAYNTAIPIIRAGFDIYLHPSRKPKPAGRLL